MIDSAKVISPGRLRARHAKPTGALHTPAVLADGLITTAQYADADRRLAWRDLQVAMQLARVSLRASTALSASMPRPGYPEAAQGPPLAAAGDRPAVGSADPTNISRVAHVVYTSAPIDAVLADRSLYERDVILAEAAALMGDKFVYQDQTSPAAHADSSIDGALVLASNWSLAEGVPSTVTVSPGLHLGVDLYKGPDQDLANRDNILAGIAVRMSDWLSNPFEVATQLLIEIRSGQGLAAEAEPYLLAPSSGSRYREWSASPFMPGRSKVVYDRQLKTVQWFDANADSRLPQPADTATTGTVARLKLGIPDSGLASVWKAQAARLRIFDFDETVISAFSVAGGQPQEFPSIITSGPAGAVSFSSPVQASGPVRAHVMVWPRGPVRVPGSAATAVSGSLVQLGGSVRFDSQPASGRWGVTLPQGQFRVWVSGRVSGAGSVAVSASGLSTGSGTFSGASLQSVDCGIANPAVRSLTLLASASSSGRLVVDEIEFRPTTATPGTIDLSATGRLCGSAGTAVWTAELGRPSVVEFSAEGSGQVAFSVQADAPAGLDVGLALAAAVSLTSVSSPRTYAPAYALAARRWKTTLLERIEWALSAAYSKAVSTAGLKQRATTELPEEVLFERVNLAPYAASAVVSVDSNRTANARQIATWSADQTYPIGQVVKYQGGYYRGRRVAVPTGAPPVINGVTNKTFWGRVPSPPIFAYECLSPGTSGASIPGGLLAGDGEVLDGSVMWRRRRRTFSAGGRWTTTSTQAWMAVITADLGPGTLRVATPADVGRPAMVPAGLFWAVQNRDGYASLPAGIEAARPEFTALQPWMLTIGASVAHQDFWV